MLILFTLVLIGICGITIYNNKVRKQIIGVYQNISIIDGVEYDVSFIIEENNIRELIFRSEGIEKNEFEYGDYKISFNRLIFDCDENRSEGSVCRTFKIGKNTLSSQNRIYTKK